MASRRYKIGRHKEYDRFFDLLKSDSPVLNISGPPNPYSIHLNDAGALRSHLLEREGAKGNIKIEDGYIWKSETREKSLALLPAAEQMIEAIQTEFEGLKQTATNQGKRPPKEMPELLKVKLLKCEARIDIVLSEITTLERFLKKFTDAEEVISAGNILARGPEGSGTLRGGILAEVDGQKVQADSDGILRIADKRSRYDKMTTADYFERICKVWLRANALLLREYMKKIQAGAIDGAHSSKPKAAWPKRPKMEAANG